MKTIELRLRLPELFDERGISLREAAHRLDGQVGQATLYRLCEQKGRVRRFDASVIAGLMAEFNLELGQVIEVRERARTRRTRRK